MIEHPRFDHTESLPEIASRGYYGVPVIHGPHWKWLIIGYFFFGGISGSSAVIAAFVRELGGSQSSPLARTATYVSFLTLAVCPPLLILDLGRPARFLNMLRAFRTSSPMSLGTWGLTAFGIISALSTVLQIADDLAARTGRRSTSSLSTRRGMSVLGAISGFFVAGYTGVLLAATAVPLWSKRPALLGPLFLSSAMTSGAAAIAAVQSALGSEDRVGDENLRTLETLSTITEGSLLVGWIIALGSTARPIMGGQLGMLLRHGAVGVGMAIPLAITAASPRLPRRMRRTATFTASALTLAGVFALRYVVVEGGRQSADNPEATFEMTG